MRVLFVSWRRVGERKWVDCVLVIENKETETKRGCRNEAVHARLGTCGPTDGHVMGRAILRAATSGPCVDWTQTTSPCPLGSVKSRSWLKINRSLTGPFSCHVSSKGQERVGTVRSGHVRAVHF